MYLQSPLRTHRLSSRTKSCSRKVRSMTRVSVRTWAWTICDALRTRDAFYGTNFPTQPRWGPSPPTTPLPPPPPPLPHPANCGTVTRVRMETSRSRKRERDDQLIPERHQTAWRHRASARPSAQPDPGLQKLLRSIYHVFSNFWQIFVRVM